MRNRRQLFTGSSTLYGVVIARSLPTLPIPIIVIPSTVFYFISSDYVINSVLRQRLMPSKKLLTETIEVIYKQSLEFDLLLDVATSNFISKEILGYKTGEFHLSRGVALLSAQNSLWYLLYISSRTEQEIGHVETDESPTHFLCYFSFWYGSTKQKNE